MTTLSIQVPVAAREPRGAEGLAQAAIALLRVLRKAFVTFNRTGASLSESIALRNVARSYERADPRLAAELNAIADRYEATHGL